MSCPNLPAKHCSSKGSNKLAMAGHSSKLPWPKIQQFLVESIFGARSHIQSLQTWHKGFTNPMLGESVSFPMIGAGQATCCKKHQWLHSIQHQTPGVRGDRWCHGGDPGRYTPAIRPHLGGPLWTHVLRRLNIIVCSLEPWITLHQVCLKPQLLEIAVAPFKIISWWDFWQKAWEFWDAASIFIWELEWWWGPYENQLYPPVIEQLAIAENTNVQNNRQGKICSYWICQARFHSRKAMKFTQRSYYVQQLFHISSSYITHVTNSYFKQRFFSSW